MEAERVFRVTYLGAAGIFRNRRTGDGMILSRDEVHPAASFSVADAAAPKPLLSYVPEAAAVLSPPAAAPDCCVCVPF